MPAFRILQLSDLHIGRHPGRVGVPENLRPLMDWTRDRLRGIRRPVPPAGFVSTHDPDLLDAAAAFAWDDPGNPADWDVVLISGDIAATGSSSDLRAAEDFLDSAAHSRYWNRSGSPTLQAAGRDVVLIPGNHDHFSLPPLCLPGCRSFDGVFGNDNGVRRHVSAFQGVEIIWKRQKGSVTLALVAADFTLQATDTGRVCNKGGFPVPGHYGQGRAYPGVMARLEQVTSDLRSESENCVVVWVIHFDPESSDDLLELLDSTLFQQACRSHQVPLVLCGHTHLGRTINWGGTTVLVCGTTAQFYVGPSGKNQLQIVSIDWDPATDPAPRISCSQFRFSPSAQAFVPDP